MGIREGLLVALALCLALWGAEAKESGDVGMYVGWGYATGTFYGGADAMGTSGGFCGYQNPFQLGYGADTAALSDSLLAQGLNCGACFEVRCKHEESDYARKYCYHDAVTVITATNLSPPGLNGEHHFDLSQPMFQKIANLEGGRLPLAYRRVPCVKKGGVRFQVVGNPQWTLALVYNVGGGGNVHEIYVKSGKSGWSWMTRNWGQNWHTSAWVQGSPLSFRLTLGSGYSKDLYNVSPSNWQYGQTFESDTNL